VKTFKYNERGDDFTMTADPDEIETMQAWFKTHRDIIRSLGNQVTSSGRGMLAKLEISIEQLEMMKIKRAEIRTAKSKQTDE
jgi:hypothetical protein